MATKQLLEETTQNRFYPVIEVAGSLESNINLPPTLALVKREFLYKGDKSGSTQAVGGLITFKAGIKTDVISSQSSSGTITIQSPVNIGGYVSIRQGSSGEAIRINGSTREIVAANDLTIKTNSGTLDLLSSYDQDLTITSGRDLLLSTASSDMLILDSSTNETKITNFTNIDSDNYDPLAVGSSTNPMYIDSSGHFAASSTTVGSSTKPIFLDNGTLTASNASVGSDKKIMYLSSGVLTESATDVAKSSQIMYLDDGELKAGYTFLLSDPIS